MKKNKAKSSNKKKHCEQLSIQFPDSSVKYSLYTDGSGGYSKTMNGGYAFVIIDESGNIVKQFSDGMMGVTTNQMELKAIVEGCKAIPEDDSEVTIYSDSKYALNVLSGHYNARVNLSLVAEHEQNKRRLRLKYKWVKGHSGNKYNDLADKLAVEARVKVANEFIANGYPSRQPMEIDGALAVKRAKYYVYATSIWNYGTVGSAFIVLDENNKEMGRGSNCVKGSLFQCIIKTITEACHNVPEIDADVIISSDIQYAIYILSGKWIPKKNFKLIQEQWDYDKLCNVSYRLCKPSNINIKEVKLMASKSISTYVNTAPVSMVDDENESYVPDDVALTPPQPRIDHYHVAFVAINISPNLVKCCYAVSRESDGIMRTCTFDEEFDATNVQQSLQTLALMILVEAFKKIPDDAKITIYSKECYPFLSGVFGDTDNFNDADDAYLISLVKYTSSLDLRQVEVENADKSRLKHAIERKLKQVEIESSPQ